MFFRDFSQKIKTDIHNYSARGREFQECSFLKILAVCFIESETGRY